MKRDKMNKKGFEISSMLGWILGILAVFIILFIVLGPNQLLAMARDAAFSFGIGVSGGGPPPTGGGSTDEIPPELIAYFNYLTGLIKNEIEKIGVERCLIPLNTIPNPEDDYFITLSPDFISIKKKVGEGYAGTDKSENIPGFNPCIVAYNGAENFYNNWLDGSIVENPDTTNPADKEYHHNDNTNSLILLQEENKLRTPNEGSGEGREYEISNEDGKRFLYKADNSHFCFISIKGGGGCKLADGNKINEGCFDEVPSYKGIMLCGDSTDSARKRILHVKIDPGDNPAERWAFHLTNDQNLPINDVDTNQKKFKDEVSGKKVCNVFSVNEEGWGQDHLATWYIAPGGRIMTKPDANRIFYGIDGKILGVTQDSSKKKGSPYPTDHSEAVGGAVYSYYVANDKCGNDYHRCALFARLGEQSNYIFIPNYELLCDDEGYWNVCGMFVKGVTRTVDGVTYTCKESSAATWVWR